MYLCICVWGQWGSRGNEQPPLETALEHVMSRVKFRRRSIHAATESVGWFVYNGGNSREHSTSTGRKGSSERRNREVRVRSIKQCWFERKVYSGGAEGSWGLAYCHIKILPGTLG